MEIPPIRSGINPANVGYLCGIILRELGAGRKCEVTGGIVATIKSRQDYDDRKYRLVGKFGEVIQRTPSGVSLIATRSPPEWAEKKIDETIWECEEMTRWFIPGDQR